MVAFSDGYNQCNVLTKATTLSSGHNTTSAIPQWRPQPVQYISTRVTTLSSGHNTTNAVYFNEGHNTTSAIFQWRPQPMQYISTRATVDGRFQQWQQPMLCHRWHLLIYWVFIFIIINILVRRCPCQLCCRLTERSNPLFLFFPSSFSILLLLFCFS